MIPLTPEQVARLRLPEGRVLRFYDGPGWCVDYLPPYGIDRVLVEIALRCANGEEGVTAEVLDAVWAIVEGRSNFYSRDGLNDYNTHASREDAFAEAEAALDSAIDSESAEECGNVEWGMLIRIGGSRETGEVTTDAEGHKVVMFELEKP
jgi:hypothetical protein